MFHLDFVETDDSVRGFLLFLTNRQGGELCAQEKADRRIEGKKMENTTFRRRTAPLLHIVLTTPRRSNSNRSKELGLKGKVRKKYRIG